jgi:hypothetical protein
MDLADDNDVGCRLVRSNISLGARAACPWLAPVAVNLHKRFIRRDTVTFPMCIEAIAALHEEGEDILAVRIPTGDDAHSFLCCGHSHRILHIRCPD